MTLKEKFENCPDKDGWINKNHSRAVNLEKIAEDFAIGFAEWYLKVSEKYDSHLKLQNDSKQLLEIYKKSL